ncbi:RBBP9/YdeN family alpha/beta hydrolase [archaeon]
MVTVFIFHGVLGHPQENWFDWLRQELEKLGCNVVVPRFPTLEGQTLENWSRVLDEHKELINEETVFVCHSLGTPFALSVIEQNTVGSAFFVAGFTGTIGHEYDDNMKTISQREFDWDKIKAHCKKFFLFHSDNDPYVAMEKAEELAEHVGGELVVVKNAGHFNAAAGYTEFELLLEKIKGTIRFPS